MTESTDESTQTAQAAAPEAPPQRLALPPPDPTPDTVDRVGLVDRLVSLIEMRPLVSTALIFFILLLLHVGVGNAAGVMSGLFVGQTLFAFAPAGLIDLLVLGLIAYNIVLPTFLARACLTAFADTAPALNCSNRVFDDHLTALASPHALVRLVFMGFWATVMTPVFGGLLQGTLPVAGAGTMLLTLWMYARLAMIFGLLGSSLSYTAMLHYRLSAALGQHLRIDLFDMSPLQPLARYGRRAVLFLSVPVAVAGPILARPEAATASATLLAIAAVLVLLASFGALWGARQAVTAAKHVALIELHAYSREIWRRAYVNGRIVEAVALPAMAGMITIRNQISRMSNWPGGWTNLARCALIATVPVLTWFGGMMVTYAMAIFAP